MTRVLDLSDVMDARLYISEFMVDNKKPTYVTLSSGRKIDFASMTDDDAITVANCLYDMRIEAERRAAKKPGMIQ